MTAEVGAEPRKLILASESPRRAFLLRKLGVPFEILPSNVAEEAAHENHLDVAIEINLDVNLVGVAADGAVFDVVLNGSCGHVDPSFVLLSAGAACAGPRRASAPRSPVTR